MIKNLIWDLDGTLFDTYPAISAAFEAALQDLGAAVPREEILPLVRVSFGHCAERLSVQTGLNPDQIMEAFSVKYAKIPPEFSPPFPDVRGLCTWAVVTGGKNLIVTHRMRSSTEALLEVHGLRELFAGWLTHDDGYPRKPAPDAFLAALEKYQIDPTETLALGDRDLDLEAAHAAGVAYSCAYGPGPFSVEADFVVQDFSDLLVLLKHQED